MFVITENFMKRHVWVTDWLEEVESDWKGFCQINIYSIKSLEPEINLNNIN
jgi:hypothetical protein